MSISNITIASVLALLPALCWLFIYYKKDYRDPEPKKIILQAFLAGTLMSILFILFRYLMINMHLGSFLIGGISGIISLILFAVLEEMAKLTAAIFVVTRHKLEFNQIIDGVIYAVSAALGFAFMENLLFFLINFSEIGYFSTSAISIIAFRSLGTMLAHTLFSGLAGLIWAYAHFSKQISPFNKKHLLAFEIKDFINHEILTLHIIRQNILKARPSRRGGHEKKILVLEGIMLAVFLHVIFNIAVTLELFGQNLTFLLVPILIGSFLYISYLFTKKMNTKILKVY